MSSLPLFREPTVQTVTLYLKETLQLLKLLLGFLLHLAKAGLVLSGLFLKFPFKLKVAGLGAVFRLLDHPGLLRFKVLSLVLSFILGLFRARELLPESLSLIECVLELSL